MNVAGGGEDVSERNAELDSGRLASQTMPARVDSTGVPNLDMVLGGGLPKRSLVIIVGPPGSGKTTLANQMAFATARARRRVLVFTALSEPTNKLVLHLRSFTFFDGSLIGDRLQFLSLQQFLDGGLEATADQLVSIARQERADLVVIDGFRGMRTSEENPRESREFLYDIGTKLSVLGITTLVTTEADPRDPMFFPEATTADVIIGLHYSLVGVRERRAIEAVKVRGSRIMTGLHGLRIEERGAMVYPRLEARVQAFETMGAPETTDSEGVEAPPTSERARFDLHELDALLQGGVPRETSTLLAGSQGTGKTLLALHFALSGVRAGEQTLFVGFRESRSQMLRVADAFDFGPSLRNALTPGGPLTLHRWPPVELHPDIVADTLLRSLDELHVRRLVVDGVTEVERAIARSNDPQRIYDYFGALVEALRRRHITSLFVTDASRVLGPDVILGNNPATMLAENLIYVQHVTEHGRLHRVLSVVKMRYSAHDDSLREFIITPTGGVRVLSRFESQTWASRSSPPPLEDLPAPQPEEQRTQHNTDGMPRKRSASSRADHRRLHTEDAP